MSTPSPQPRRRYVWLTLAGLYSVLGIAMLIGGWPGISDDPVGLAPAIMLALPWSLLLRTLPAGMWPAIAVVIAGLALNAGILWWLAVRPRSHAG